MSYLLISRLGGLSYWPADAVMYNHLSDISLRGGDGEDDDDHGASGYNFICLPSFFYTESEDDIYNGIWDFISISLVFLIENDEENDHHSVRGFILHICWSSFNRGNKEDIGSFRIISLTSIAFPFR